MTLTSAQSACTTRRLGSVSSSSHWASRSGASARSPRSWAAVADRATRALASLSASAFAFFMAPYSLKSRSPRLLEQGAPVGAAGHCDAAAATELQEPFVTQHPHGREHRVPVEASPGSAPPPEMLSSLTAALLSVPADHRGATERNERHIQRRFHLGWHPPDHRDISRQRELPELDHRHRAGRGGEPGEGGCQRFRLPDLRRLHCKLHLRPEQCQPCRQPRLRHCEPVDRDRPSPGRWQLPIDGSSCEGCLSAPVGYIIFTKAVDKCLRKATLAASICVVYSFSPSAPYEAHNVRLS